MKTRIRGAGLAGFTALSVLACGDGGVSAPDATPEAVAMDLAPTVNVRYTPANLESLSELRYEGKVVTPEVAEDLERRIEAGEAYELVFTRGHPASDGRPARKASFEFVFDSNGDGNRE